MRAVKIRARYARAQSTVPRDVPPTRPARRRAAARADRRAHAARRAGGELLVPAPPRRLRVDRRARRRPARRRHGVRRGLRRRRAGAHAPRRSSASTPNPEAHEHARLRYARPSLRFARDLVETLRASRATPSSFLQTIEHVAGPGRRARALHVAAARPAASAYVSTPNVLTLAPEGAERSGNPWHVHEYRAEEFRGAAASAHFAAVELLRPVPRAQAARARARRSDTLGWDARARAARPHQAVLRLVHAGDLRARLRAARRDATSTGALDFVAVCRP